MSKTQVGASYIWIVRIPLFTTSRYRLGLLLVVDPDRYDDPPPRYEPLPDMLPLEPDLDKNLVSGRNKELYSYNGIWRPLGSNNMTFGPLEDERDAMEP